jgi:hypothetical protein
MMREMTSEQVGFVGNWKTAPMDDKVTGILHDNRDALDYLQLAAEIKPCDWGIVQAGPDTPLPHLNKARWITRMACLRARYRFSRGENLEGVRDICAVLSLASQCNCENSESLISMVVKAVLRNAAVDAVSANLAGLDAKALKTLTDQLDSSPPGPGFMAALRMEQKGFLEPYLQSMRNGDLAVTQKLLDGLLEAPGQIPLDWKLWIPEGKATPEMAKQFARQLEELDTSYQRLIDAASLPLAEFQGRVSEEAEKLDEAQNAFAAFTQLSAISNTRYSDAQAETLLLMLRAAAAIVQDGPDKLKDFKDPYGSGPFEYRVLQGGFELKSELVVRGKAVTLTVGGR